MGSVLNTKLLKQIQRKLEDVGIDVQDYKELIDIALGESLDPVVNNAVVQTDIENKLNQKEQEYAPRLTSVENYMAELNEMFYDNAGFHNSIYRGKFLGNEVTSEQWDSIADGTFRDMYIGDYWIINGTTYLIAAFNYYINSGSPWLTTNHVTLVPARSLYNHHMNPTGTTEGGYVGSEMYTTGLDQAKTKIHADFSGHVITHTRYLCNVVADGQASAGTWFNSDVELMNEVMVFGSVVSGKGTYGSYNIGTEKSQLPLFALRPDLLNIRATWWLRDVCSALRFAHVNSSGAAGSDAASIAFGVRPVFSISA